MFPFGEKCQNNGLVSAENPYLYGGKEKATLFGIDWYDSGARFQTTDGLFSGIDPLLEQTYPISPYAYCAGDPVNRVDPEGKASGDYYLNGFHVYDDGLNDRKIYEIPLIENYLRTRITWGRPVLVANERSIKLSFSGIANDLRPSLAEGTVSVIQEGTNGREYTKMIISGVGGPYGNGAPQNGEYSVDTPRIRAESGFTKNRVGFSFNLNPLFDTKRKYLRIHPDGNSHDHRHPRESQQFRRSNYS